MYDRRLDAIIAAAELGSFSKAAARLNISTPALVKQVKGFEGEYHLVLFERTHAGVKLTAAGEILVQDARGIVRRSDEALHRARAAGGAVGAVRMGVSITSPGRQTLEYWPQAHQLEPDLRLELVTVGSLYANQNSPMLHLGQDIDVVQTSFSSVRWQGACNLLYLFDAPFYIDIPRTRSLSARSHVGIEDLKGMRVRVLRHGHDAMDRLREAFLLEGDIEVVDVDTFDTALLNSAMETGDAVVTTGAWSGLHPGLVSVAFDWPEAAPCYLAYPLNPTPQVERFVRAIAKVAGGRTS